MPEEKKEQVMKVLKQFKDKKFSIVQLGKMISNISYPTLLKWVMVLEGEGKIIIDDYGNIKLVYFNKDFKDG